MLFDSLISNQEPNNTETKLHIDDYLVDFKTNKNTLVIFKIRKFKNKIGIVYVPFLSLCIVNTMFFDRNHLKIN